ncbi:MAG TPA: CvpA family protein [Candidatus Omnitrophota bacterium]|nr:CvpA family protein [Candidatus Omnitrophota bacterium]
MFSDLISSINWIDLLIIGFGIRIIYIGIKNGFAAELFKLAGVLCAIFVTFHYYSGLARLLHSYISVSESLLVVLCYGVLLTLVLLLFKLMREGAMALFKVQAHPLLDQWGGFVISLVRSLLVGSLVLVSLQIIPIDYLQKNGKKSFFHPYLFDLSLKFYEGCYKGVVSKFFPNERLNPAVFKPKGEKTSEVPE